MNKHGRDQGTSLEDLIERLREIDQHADPVELQDVLDQIEQRSFGAILIFAGILVLAPIIGDIPGVPTLAALLVAITALQILVGRTYFWLPRFLLRRSISRSHLQSALNFMLKPARVSDRVLNQRLDLFASGLAVQAVALAVLGIAAVMPLLELIPLSANLAGLALCAFGAALVVRDGLFALISMALTVGVFAIVVTWLIGIQWPWS